MDGCGYGLRFLVFFFLFPFPIFCFLGIALHMSKSALLRPFTYLS